MIILEASAPLRLGEKNKKQMEIGVNIDEAQKEFLFFVRQKTLLSANLPEDPENLIRSQNPSWISSALGGSPTTINVAI